MIKSFSSQQINQANSTLDDFLRNGWNSAFGLMLKRQGLIGAALPLGMFIYQGTKQNRPNRSDLWQPLETALYQTGFSASDMRQLLANPPGIFSGIQGSLTPVAHGDSNPQSLVEKADQIFQSKGLALAKGLLTDDPRTLSRLAQVRQGAQSGDWANRQIMAYAREALLEAGAPALLVSQATMHGEGDMERAVEATITRANAHDQNAMAMLDQVRRQALRGVPEAQAAYNHALQIVTSGKLSSGDMSPLASRVSQGDLRGATMGAEKRPTRQNVRHAQIATHAARAHHPIHTLPGGGSGTGGGGSTPIDRLIAAAKAGDPVAIRELNRIMAAETRGDQRATSLMRAIRHKATNSPQGKKARAVALSHGKPLTRKRIAKMAGDFGYEYGPTGANLFLKGVAQPMSPVPSTIDPEVANCITTGQCVGMARNLQAVRVPGANLSSISPLMGWEQGEASTTRATMGTCWGDEGQITAAQAGDTGFARHEIARGDIAQIQVNRTAFMDLLKQRNQLAKNLDNMLAEIADMKQVARLPPTIIIITSDTGDDGTGTGDFLVGMSAAEAASPVAGDIGDEGQITAAQMGDPNFATQQLATGNIQQIDVNRDAFQNLFQQREVLTQKLAAATAERNALIQQIH